MIQVRKLPPAALAFAGVMMTGAAHAQSSYPYFKGKTVTIAVGGTAGGGIDIGARLLARYLGKYLPGEPKVQVQLVPGAGGVRLIEQLYAVAPKDGSFIGAFSTGPIIEPLISLRNVKYKISDFTAVGASASPGTARRSGRWTMPGRARSPSPEPAPPPRPISFRSRSMQCWARNSASSRAMSAPRKR